MNKKTPLENLLFKSGLKIGEFADKIGLSKSTFESQLYHQKNRHVDYAFKYGRMLEVDTIEGYAYGVHFELVIGGKNN
jgi:hypothetical protein